MNSACALSGVGTVHPPCAFYGDFDKRLGDALKALNARCAPVQWGRTGCRGLSASIFYR